MLQRLAVCCSVLQYVCSVRTLLFATMLSRVVSCSVLTHVECVCSGRTTPLLKSSVLPCAAECCGVLQCASVCSQCKGVAARYAAAGVIADA